jgi:hypothetical protein
VFEEEERKARTKIYEGDDSLGKRALQRVLMRKQLEQMAVELRELMVYQSPPELGALYTEVEEMMVQMGKEQKVLITKQIQREEIENRRRIIRKKEMMRQAMIGISIVTMIFFMGGVFVWVAYDRQQKYPQYGNGLFPKTEQQRRQESQPQIYVGR